MASGGSSPSPSAKEEDMKLDIKLLYVEEFEGKGDMLYPETGQVYRAIKRVAPATGGYYQLIFDHKDEEITGMFIPSLITDTGFFKCKLREVTVEELLEITENDAVFERVAQWGVEFKDGLDDDLLNLPTMHRITKTKKLVDVLTDILMKRSIEDAAHGLEDDMLTEIKKEEPELGAALAAFEEHVLSSYKDKYEASGITNPCVSIRYSERYGKGSNVHNAYKYLHRYMSDGFDKSNNPKDLYKAMHYLLFELTRLNINGKD